MNFAGERRRVVVLGGGFGGAYAAQGLAKRLPKDWELTLIDRNNFLLFYPLLVEAGVGNLEPRHVVVPLRRFAPKANFLMAEVRGVDLGRRTVRYQVVGSAEQTSIIYDHLVLALGSVTKLPPIPGLREHGFELKSLGDAIELRDRGIRLLELANTLEDAASRRSVLRTVVVGSNFTGIEFAGEFQDFMTDALRSYPNVKREELSVVVLELAGRILPALDDDLASFAHKHLARRGVDIRTRMSVAEVRPEAVTLTSGEVLPTATTVWCAGIAPNPLIGQIEGLQTDEQGWIECGGDLRAKGHDNVWAVGDIAKIPAPDGETYAATAQNASRQGTHVAHNVARVITSMPPTAFEFTSVGALAALGCRTAVARIMGVNVSGFLAWWLYRTVYVMKMPSWSRRIRIVLDWTVELFFARDVVQLGLRRQRDPSPTEEVDL